VWCREHYFSQGLYYQGGMGKLCLVMHWLCLLTGLTATKARFCNATTLDEQKRIWNGLWLIRFLKAGPGALVNAVVWLASLVFLNRIVLWYGGGVPAKQFDLIVQDKVHIGSYIARTFHGVAQHSHLRKDNYFYYNCLMGRFTRDNCPEYLKPDSFKARRPLSALPKCTRADTGLRTPIRLCQNVRHRYVRSMVQRLHLGSCTRSNHACFVRISLYTRCVKCATHGSPSKVTSRFRRLIDVAACGLESGDHSHAGLCSSVFQSHATRCFRSGAKDGLRICGHLLSCPVCCSSASIAKHSHAGDACCAINRRSLQRPRACRR
jgi:Protein of unknown function (DUF3419)